MWLAQTDNVSFTWLDGHSYNLKDIKLFDVFDTFVKIKLKQNDQIDEIASRVDVYGNGTESYASWIFECNAEKIVENDYDLSKLHEIKIPVVT